MGDELRKKLNSLFDRLTKFQPRSYVDTSVRELYAVVADIHKLQERKKGTTSGIGGGEQSAAEKERAQAKLIAELRKWLDENGAQCINVEPRPSPHREEGLGLFATSDIGVDDDFLCVPEKLMMTEAAALASPELGWMRSDPILAQIPSLKVAIFLLSEKANLQSLWRPYIRLLPASFNTPLYWTLDELAALNGSPLLEEALRLWKGTLQQYHYFYHKIEGLDGRLHRSGKFTLREFVWAVSVVMTRQNKIPVAEDKYQVALIPLWDLCNHRSWYHDQPGQITTYHDVKEGKTKAKPPAPVAKGHQVYIFYGDRSYADLLLFSGFVTNSDASDDTMLLPFSLPDTPQPDAADETAAARNQAIARALELAGIRVGSKQLVFRNGVSRELAAAARICVASLEQLQQQPTDFVAAALDEQPVSEENEAAARQFLVGRLRSCLQAYATTVPEDEALLKGDLSVNLRNAVRIRLQEKRALASCVHTLETGEPPKEEIPKPKKKNKKKGKKITKQETGA